jgi:hypothetical protein
MASSAPPTNGSASGFFATLRSGFSAYARWLDSISWKRFFLIAVLTLIVAGIMSDLPPFNIRWGEDTVIYKPRPVTPPKPPAPPTPPGTEKAAFDINGKSYTITVDKSGVRVGPADAPEQPASAASAPARGVYVDLPGVKVQVPEEGTSEGVREAIAEAQEAIKEAMAEAREAAEGVPHGMREIRIKAFRPGDHMPSFAFLLIVISGITKLMAAGRFKAEAQAVVATEMAESEALKRQVVEARMAAMQAQVEPHFLFNTLASIDHLIETDPPRASKMQKNLIALLRASMPTMREANAQGARDLGRELAVIKPYLEILKVRMEDRLATEIRVSDGLLSAEFPPMMLQSLVENAIKHGLEPKPEGGTLSVHAEIVHGKLAVTVADTGLGFGKAATAGTGIGLANIRERLQLLYGNRAGLTVTENPGGGTAVTITVPYLSNSEHTA